MSSKSRVFTIHIDDVYIKAGLKKTKCKEVDIKWDKTSCGNIICEQKAGGLLKVQIPPDCSDGCFYALITCLDKGVKCTGCESKRIKICPCSGPEDCSNCEDCINGYCISTCKEEEFCSGNDCVECDPDNPCPNGQICVGGKCQCPANRPYQNKYGICTSCRPDEDDCGPCEYCTEDGCKPLCEDGKCCPDTNTCVECTKTGHCGPNQVCLDKKCVCGEGFIRDVDSGECVPAPPCERDSDCLDPCMVCDQYGNCVPKICPPNFTCYNGECVPKCDCGSGPCDSERACIPTGRGDCACVSCSVLSCNEEGTANGCQSGSNKYCYCDSSDNCKPNPCKDKSCTNGLDCGKDCGCYQNTCVPCTIAPDGTLGCDDDPCSNFSCDEQSGPAACQGGSESRPDCGCNSAGDCVTQPCGDNTFELTKTDCNSDDCRLTATLTNNKCCPCPSLLLEVDNELLSSTQVLSNVHLRKNVSGSPYLTDDLHPLVNNEDELTAGTLTVYFDYNYLNTGSTSNNFYTVTEQVSVSLAETGANVVQSVYNDTFNVRALGSIDPNDTNGVLDNFVVRYEVTTELKNSRNTCHWDTGVVANFEYNSITPFNELFKSATIFESSACSLPEFKWYRGSEVNAFRKIYVPRDGNGQYVDYIENDPTINDLIVTDGAIDERNDLLSGLPYRVVTSCGCNGPVEATPDCSSVYFCEHCNVDWVFNGCNNEARLTEDLFADCLLNRDLQGQDINSEYIDISQVSYIITVHDTNGGVKTYTSIANLNTGLIWDTNEVFTPNSGLISSIEYKMNHDVCEECVFVKQVDNTKEPSIDFGVSCVCDAINGGNLISYTIDTNESSNDCVLTVKGATRKGLTNIYQQFIIANGSNTTGQSKTTEYSVDIDLDCGCGVISKNQTGNVECSVDNNIIQVRQVPPDCGSTVYNLEAFGFDASGGTFVWKDCNGNIIPNEVSSTVQIDAVNYPSCGYFTVEFTTSSGITLTSDINISLAITSTVAAQGSVGSSIQACNDPYQLVFALPSDITSGTVDYLIGANAGTANVINGQVLIDVPLNPSGEIVEIVNTNFNNDCVDFIPSVYNIVWGEGCTIDSISTVQDDICEGATFDINLTGSGNCLVTLNFYQSGTSNLLFTKDIQFAGSGLYSIANLPVGAYTVSLGNLSGSSSCGNSIDNTNNASVGIQVNSASNSSASLTQCIGMGNGTNNFTITVYNQNGVLDTNALFSIPVTNNGDGTYTGNVSQGTVINITTSGAAICGNNMVSVTVDCSCQGLPTPDLQDASYCAGASSVSTFVTNSNGYTVNWIATGGIPNGNQYDISNPTGTYTISVNYSDDSTGCVSDTVTKTITQQNSLNVQINNNNSGTEEYCIGDNVTLSGTVNGGSSPTGYTWEWINIDGSTVIGNTASISFIFDSSNVGTYTLNVTDTVTGCMGTSTITLVEGDCTPTCDCNMTVVSNSCEELTLSFTGDCSSYTSIFTGSSSTPYNGETSLTLTGITAGQVLTTLTGSPDCSNIQVGPTEVNACCDCEINIVSNNCEEITVTSTGDCSGYTTLTAVFEDGTDFSVPWVGSGNYQGVPNTLTFVLTGNPDCDDKTHGFVDIEGKVTSLNVNNELSVVGCEVLYNIFDVVCNDCCGNNNISFDRTSSLSYTDTLGNTTVVLDNVMSPSQSEFCGTNAGLVTNSDLICDLDLGYTVTWEVTYSNVSSGSSCYFDNSTLEGVTFTQSLVINQSHLDNCNCL